MSITTNESSGTNNDLQSRFYDLANKHVQSLNKKFQAKAVITLKTKENILQCLLKKQTWIGDSHFRSWCLRTFEIQNIRSENILADAKTHKPILLYEEMYSIFKQTHIQTAHGGRDKCLDSLAVNYSWVNRSLLQIFLKMCPSCETRKTVKIPMFSKPIIELGISCFVMLSLSMRYKKESIEISPLERIVQFRHIASASILIMSTCLH